MNLKKVGSVYVPEQTADEIGFGCPKCDDHELVPTNQREHNVSAIVTEFRKRHRNCGDLETLERINGKLIVTGKVPALGPS